MKKYLTATIIILMIPMLMNAQTYSSLWKQVSDAEQKDLPQTAQKALTQIIKKAETEKEYGQLLKAELKRSRSICEVSPDSLRTEVETLKAKVESLEMGVLQAIYNCVLGNIYEHNRWLDEDRHMEMAHDFYEKALAHPDELAAVKATDYEPFVVKGQDSRYFGDDLLSVIGWQAKRFDILCDYYQKAGFRRAALLAEVGRICNERPTEREPLNKSRHIQRLDSLIYDYQDLVECGEAAVARFEYMDEQTDATREQKWQYINGALERWGNWQRMNVLRNAQRQLTKPMFDATVHDRVTIPQQERRIGLVQLRNITEVTLRVYKANVNGNTELNPENTEGYKKLKPLLTSMPELTQTRQYVGKRPYEIFEDSITLAGLPVGVYMLEMESQPATRTARCLVFVSDVRVITQALPEKKLRIVAVNATTGQPIKGATVTMEYSFSRDKKTDQLTTDEQGECMYTRDADRNYKILVHTAADKACPPMNMFGFFNYNDQERASTNVAVFTDRAIYRPGQTVFAAAVVYSTENGRDYKAVANKTVRMQLLDANYTAVSEQQVNTDDYGTATAQFVLPSQGLTGNYSILANNQTTSFRVEEYKRPAFEVEIPEVAQNYEDGDTVVARGNVRSYAGVPVQGAKVKYKVVRRRAFWWVNYSRYWERGSFGIANRDEVMAEGETVTDDKGQFTADMPMVLPMTSFPMFYNFVLTADVTDQAGETHQGELTLPLGNRKTAFTATIPEKVLSEGDAKMAFHQQNAAGVDLDAAVRYRFDGGRWQEARTNKVFSIPQMKSGKHTLHAICENDTLEQDFVVFSLDDTRPVTDLRSWFYASREQFPMTGEPVTVQAGSSDKNVHVVYTVISGDKVLESGTAELSNELINRKFAYSEAYGNGLLLTFAWMKEGVPYTWNTTICRPMPDMHLDMKWKTFRNRLTPGQQEEWTLAVTKPDGSPADAQLVATLYDKSLDQLTEHNWSLAPAPWIPLPSTRWSVADWGGETLHGEKSLPWLAVQDMQYSHFDPDVFPYYTTSGWMRLRGVGGGFGSAVPQRAMMKSSNTMMMDVAVYESADASLEERVTGFDSGEEEAVKEMKQAPVQLRENLQETAFFYPQMVTDSTGHINLKFTLPESLTTWRFLSVAHTRDMMYGTLSDEAVARKDVMIQPNMPRFLRHGDEGTISARIINMSDQALSGTAMLQLLDPETERVLIEQKQQVSVADSSTTSVTFNIQPSTLNPQPSLLIARVSISTPKHSDGEQHYLTLLPNTERVTVTVPFTQIAPGKKEIDLKRLIPVDDPKAKLTVEYTNNPAWLMIQALPWIGHPHDDCAVCQVTSLYANSIGRHIIKQNPTAKHVFEQWSREKGEETSLMSNLQKDSELKELLLSETPWVMEANSEQDQKKQLADFFDQNLIDQRIETAIEKLDDLQNGDGSWSWWPGMKGSALMTTSICEILVRLNQMTGEQAETKKMLAKAFDYLGDNIVELVKEMKKEEKKGIKQTFPSHRALEWLYICALDGRQLPAKTNEANDYLKNLLKKETTSQTILEKALSAIVLNNRTYIRSLKEWTVYKEDMGRYYDTQRASYSWRDYKIPTQVAAIEAIKRLTPQDTVTISEMQRWLLQEKRTQAWDTPLNSADAIYAFLNGNSQSLAPQPKTVLAIDGKALDTSDATAGLGYVKTTIPQSEKRASTFTAEKTSTGTSWGAVYAQFTQPASDITDQASGISVKREVLSAEGLVLRDLSNSPLTVGNRIKVRITIEAERDYDFVQIIDKRAACMEPVEQLSGYNWRGGYYCTPKDQVTCFFFDVLSKGRHVIETEYYVDREGTYETGSCTVQCAYAPEFHGTTKSIKLRCNKDN